MSTTYEKTIRVRDARRPDQPWKLAAAIGPSFTVIAGWRRGCWVVRWNGEDEQGQEALFAMQNRIIHAGNGLASGEVYVGPGGAWQIDVRPAEREDHDNYEDNPATEYLA